MIRNKLQPSYRDAARFETIQCIELLFVFRTLLVLTWSTFVPLVGKALDFDSSIIVTGFFIIPFVRLRLVQFSDDFVGSIEYASGRSTARQTLWVLCVALDRTG